jgi:hypothetical protein
VKLFLLATALGTALGIAVSHAQNVTEYSNGQQSAGQMSGGVYVNPYSQYNGSQFQSNGSGYTSSQQGGGYTQWQGGSSGCTVCQ